MSILKTFLNLFVGKKGISKRVSITVDRDWHDIQVLLTGGSPSQLRQALVISDRSLDAVLKDLVSGNTMGERLINAKNMFHPQTYEKLWQAHKLRNALVHESGFEAQHFIIKAAVENLKGGLKELGIKL